MNSSGETSIKFLDMNCLSWLPPPQEAGTKRESRENRELSRNCDDCRVGMANGRKPKPDTCHDE